MSTYELFRVDSGDEWPVTEAWVAGGLLGQQYFELLVAAGFSDQEASGLAIVALGIEDAYESRRYVQELAKFNGFNLNKNEAIEGHDDLGYR